MLLPLAAWDIVRSTLLVLALRLVTLLLDGLEGGNSIGEDELELYPFLL